MGDQAHYVSNFRSSLTALVVLHHTAVSYGGEGGHTFRSSHHPPGSSAAMVGFNAVNQSFFMGSFFLLAGHYSKVSLQRKSPKEFIQGRLYRLVLPTAAYSLLGPPLCRAVIQSARGEAPSWSLLSDHLRNIRGVMGPVWFTAVLFIFDTALALLKSRMVTDVNSNEVDNRVGEAPKAQRTLGPEAAVALCSVADFIWRLEFPVNRMFRPLNLNLGYLPQYLVSYWLGTRITSPRDIIAAPAVNMRLLLVSLASGFALVNTMQQKGTGELLGGFSLTAAAYAVWNNTTGYLLGNSLLSLFSTHCQTSWGRVNDFAFPAFLAHIPVSVLVEAHVDNWNANAVTKTVVIGTANVVASWVVGYGASALWEKVIPSRRARVRKIDGKRNT